MPNINRNLLWIKLISICGFIISSILLLTSLNLIIKLPQSLQEGIIVLETIGLFSGIILCLPIAIFGFKISLDLWKGKNCARITTIILNVLLLIFLVSFLVMVIMQDKNISSDVIITILFIILDGLIIFYLNKASVKENFS